MRFQMFYESDDGLWRPLAVENVGAVERAAVRDTFKIFQRVVGFGFGEPYFYASLVAGGLF